MKRLERKQPPVARTTEGQPSLVEASGNASIRANQRDWQVGRKVARDGAVRALQGSGYSDSANVAYRSPAGQIWRYSGKRGRVLAMLAMLATNPAGLTQWDTLPWHTRLGGTIHALRRDGLAIDTEREGEFRHARYRLATPGALVEHASKRGQA